MDECEGFYGALKEEGKRNFTGWKLLEVEFSKRNEQGIL